MFPHITQSFRKSIIKCNTRLVTMIAGAVLATSGVTHAQNVYWNGGSNSWANIPSWVNFDGTPFNALPGSTNFATFDQLSPADLHVLGGNQSVGALLFQDNTDGYTIGDGTGADTLNLTAVTNIGIKLDATPGGGNAIVNFNLNVAAAQSWVIQTERSLTTAGNLTLSANLTLTDDATNNQLGGSFIIGSTGNVLQQNAGNRTIFVHDLTSGTDVTINSNIALTESATTGRRLFLNTQDGATVEINGDMTNGAGGASGFTKQGVGTLTMNGDILYTSGNGTVVDGGIFNVNGNISAGSGQLAVNNNSTLNISGASNVTSGAWVISNGTVNVDGGAGVINMGGLILGNTSTPGNVTLNTSGKTLNITGSIVSRIGSSSFILDENFALNGGVTAEVWKSSVEDALVLSGIITDGTSAGGLTKTRAGKLVISGSNSTTGANFLGQGRIELDFTSNNDNKLGSGIINIGGMDLLLTGSETADSIQQSGNLNVFARGASNVILTPGASQNLTLKLGNISRGTDDGGIGGTINFVLPNQRATVETTAADTVFIGGWATVETDTGSHFVAISGGKVVASVSTNGDMIGSGWAPSITNKNVSDDAGFSGSSDYMRATSLRISAGNSLNVIESLYVDGGGILVSSTSTSAGIFGGNLYTGNLVGSLGAELIINQMSSTDFEIGSNIRRSDNIAAGAINITKSGLGTLILSGKNQTAAVTTTDAASGTLFLNEGTVVLKGGNALSDNTAIVFDPRFNAVLRLEDDETVGSISSNGLGLDGEGTVDVGNNSLTIKQSGGQTYSGSLQGSGTIIKDNLDQAIGSVASWTLNTSSNDNFTGSLVVNKGLVVLSGVGVRNLDEVASVTLNHGGGLIVDNNNSSLSLSRINDGASVVMNGANGRASTTGANNGLHIRTNQGAVFIETVQDITFNAGANYFLGEALASSSGSATVIEATAGFTRNNSSTLSVRGTNLGGPGTVGRTRLRITPNTAAAVAFANQFRANGAYANGATALATTANANAPASTAKDISIVPWAVGESFSSNTGVAANVGNSFVTYISNDFGFVPLHLVNQYNSYALAGATDNVRESLTANLTVAAGDKNINSLLINNQNNGTSTAAPGSNVTFSGASGSTLSVTSGAFLFTGVGAANATSGLAAANAFQGGITINGFSGIAISGPNKEYIFFANNNSAAGTTIESALVTSATMTKSGQGLLHLKGDNSAITDVTLNEGTLRIDNLNNIGGVGGELVFAGGSLQLGTDWNTVTSGSLLDKTVRIEDGSLGILDTNAASRTDITNNVTIGALSGSGTFVKRGLGTLTMGGSTASTFTGLFVLEGASGQLQDDVSVLLDNSGGNAIAGDILIGALNGSPSGRSVLQLGRSNQIADTSVITFKSNSGSNAFFQLAGHDETVAGIVNTNRESVVQVTQSQTLADGTSTLTLAGSGEYYYDGYLRNSAGGGNGTLTIVKTGAGTQTFTGDRIGYTGTTTIEDGVLRLRDTTALTSSTITNNATLEIERTNITDWTYARVISGTGTLRKTGVGTGRTILNAANTYTGITDIDAGTLTLGANGSINESAAINIKHGAILDVTAKGATGYSYNKLLSGGGIVNGNFNLASGGSLRVGASSNPNANSTTGDLLGSFAFNGNFSIAAGSNVQMQISGASFNDTGINAAFQGGTLSSYLTDNAATLDSYTFADAASGVPNHDYVDVSGEFQWNSGAKVTYELTSGAAFNSGDVLNLWDWLNLGGTFDLGTDASLLWQRGGGVLGDLELPDIAGLIYDLTLFNSHGIIVVIVPEPAPGLLCMLAVVIGLTRRRRSR